MTDTQAIAIIAALLYPRFAENTGGKYTHRDAIKEAEKLLNIASATVCP